MNLKTLLNLWKQRKLSIKGKITIINNLALSPIIYVSSVIDTPPRVINEVNNLIQNFIWDGSTSKISQKTLIQQIEKGGLKLCHFDSKIKALKLSWVKRLITKTDTTWTILPKHYYKCKKLNTFFNANHALLTKDSIPKFY